ncbi:peptidase M18 [Rhodotorula diobovata]|uniref:aspartyl aminopeptidase n=1 Tax=Rhodotorula diobovata TaxID=5288 RepID=A0A5C5FXJ4_9BASI|nr:peptidase M18 [Rhodotorula diobovata]
MANPLSSPALAPSRSFLRFVDASPTPYHAVANCVANLEEAGFSRLHERDSWADKVKPGSKLFVTRNQSSIIAFTVPEDAGSKPLGFSVAGCHTDSPRFIVKPVSKREKVGFTQVAVETYGGGLWATWMDRDLGIAGRVTLAGAKGASADTYTSHLVTVRQPILRMPTIAIHLERTQNDKFYYNPETQQVPILALASKELNRTLLGDEGAKSAAEVSFADPLDITSHHSPVLLHTVAQQLSEELGEEVKPSQIHDFELSLFDVQPATIGGALNEFIFSARLDNLFSSFAATEALILSSKSSLPSDGRVSMIALFDNEEVGSVSAYGAESNFIESVFERVAVALKADNESEAEAYQRTLAKSFLLSTDVAHSVHPGFVDKHEENHRPLINSGIAIKTNVKQRYATTSNTVFPLRRVAAEAGVPLSEFVVRNDCACGSTIGPLVSKIGLRTVDIGAPILSMHSVREMGGVRDMASLVSLFERFFERMGHLDTLAETVD